MANRLSIPELEGQIATLQAELLERRAAQQPHTSSMYACPRCSSLYQSIWGCGCPLFPGERRQTAPDERHGWSERDRAGIVAHMRTRWAAILAALPDSLPPVSLGVGCIDSETFCDQTPTKKDTP